MARVSMTEGGHTRFAGDLWNLLVGNIQVFRPAGCRVAQPGLTEPPLSPIALNAQTTLTRQGLRVASPRLAT